MGAIFHRSASKAVSMRPLAVGFWMLAAMALRGPGTAAAQIPKEALPLVGAWDITIHTSHGDAYSWQEVERSGATLVGRFVGRFGSARPISKIEFLNGGLHFGVPRQYEAHDLEFTGKPATDGLAGSATGYDDGPATWTARRAPRLARTRPPVWGEPIKLFNGTSLDGWQIQGGENRWVVVDNVLVNMRDGGNLVSTAKFDDFKLHAEFRYPPKSNSGIYLRGRYEIQIDDGGPNLTVQSSGAVYGFFAPCVYVAKRPGEWQTFDITLVGRMVTVVFNGETVIDRQTIPGITGGALDADEGSPGPIMIQGDHGRIDFRNVTITPATHLPQRASVR